MAHGSALHQHARSFTTMIFASKLLAAFSLFTIALACQPDFQGKDLTIYKTGITTVLEWRPTGKHITIFRTPKKAAFAKGEFFIESKPDQTYRIMSVVISHLKNVLEIDFLTHRLASDHQKVLTSKGNSVLSLDLASGNPSDKFVIRDIVRLPTNSFQFDIDPRSSQSSVYFALRLQGASQAAALSTILLQTVVLRAVFILTMLCIWRRVMPSPPNIST